MLYGVRDDKDQASRVGVIVATTNADGGVAHVIYADSKSPLYVVPQSFFQPSIQQLKRVPSRNQKSKMTESPFSVGTNVEFALQDESATSSVAVKWVGRAFPERLQLTFKEGVPHIVVDAASSGDALWIYYGEFEQMADAEDEEALKELPVDTPLRANLAIDLNKIPPIPRIETFRPSYKLRLVSAEAVHDITLEAQIQKAPWKQKGEEPAKSDTVHSQPRNDDSDVEMENDNGSERAGGNTDSSPITQAEGEEDGRLRNVEAIYRDQHLMDCTIRVTRDGTEFRAHKLLLAYGSERFYKEFVEKQAADVTIGDCSSQAVRTLLDSIYGKDLDVVVMDECATELLPLADEHKVMALKALAVSRLLLQVDPGNVLELARLAYYHNVPELMQRCASVLDANRQTIFKTTAWRELLMGSTEVAADLLELC